MPQKYLFDAIWGVGVYGSMISVSFSSWFEFARHALLRWRIRRELKQLKNGFKKLHQALSRAEEMKSAINRWPAKNK
jgi:hypothetical protein